MAGNTARFINLTPEDLYWLGWLASDGCVDRRLSGHWRISLELKASDYSTIKEAALYLGAKEPKYRESKNSWAIAVQSNILARRLINLGITERKSNTLLVVPELANKAYFWRGVLDGDGSIRENNRNLEVALYSNSPGFLEQFKLFYPDCKIQPHSGSCLKAISYCGDARRLLRRLYDGSYSHLALERKQPVVRKWTR